MANGVFNISKGRVNEYVSRVASNDPTNSTLVVVLLKTVQSDTDLRRHATLGTILANAGNDEADFTNYERKVLNDTLVSAPSVDNVADNQSSDIPNQTWASAGGAVNNTTTKLIVCYDNDSTGGTDANLIPLTHHDFVATTDGNDVTATVAEQGFFTAQ